MKKLLSAAAGLFLFAGAAHANERADLDPYFYPENITQSCLSGLNKLRGEDNELELNVFKRTFHQDRADNWFYRPAPFAELSFEMRDMQDDVYIGPLLYGAILMRATATGLEANLHLMRNNDKAPGNYCILAFSARPAKSNLKIVTENCNNNVVLLGSIWHKADINLVTPVVGDNGKTKYQKCARKPIIDVTP